ncbi:DUF1801 domain-containing protein [Flavobacterium sp. CYK-55]|uniref:DUF1801 domain-containing protein n=1 Tax=Flavobacterium sp. CYK-55 TaxID=2835529 RepID=UPI001BCCBC53|nr:DUF1801 domain-containing protein [Flavobacterium sp. CYK-55]MBS7788106.1 DUF1801 domain-containing protein [Flavobacterium sp. CYK-55]
MTSKATTPQEYIDGLESDRKFAIEKIRLSIKQNLPDGFHEQITYGMLGYVVPHALYPKGYHCDPKLPLPFLSVASQKNFIALYHMGVYAQKDLYDWFVAEYPKHCKTKLDMGKSCIRFKKLEDIPYQLIAELAGKMTVQQWIDCYESAFNKS